MPAWGDRMTDAEIQAIVGFLRQWEATAPEVAQPMGPPSGVGGPPWLRNNTQPTEIPAVQPTATAVAAAHQPGADTGQTGQGDGPPWAREQVSTSESKTLDWRTLTLITGGFAMAFILTFTGYSALKKNK